MNRKGDTFMVIVNIIFLMAILLIFFKLALKFTTENADDHIGTRQLAVMNTYAMSEQLLTHLDVASRRAAYQAFGSLALKGGRTGLDDRCGTYASYERWTAPPGYGQENCIKTDLLADFRREFGSVLPRTITHPGMPNIGYTIQTSRENEEIHIVGKTKDQINIPILAPEDDSHTFDSTSGLAFDLTTSSKGVFAPDTNLLVTVHETQNHEERKTEITHVVIHTTNTRTAEEAFQKYTEGSSSVHYVIGKNGAITQMVPEERRALHTDCTLGCERDLEDGSIGIAVVAAPPILVTKEGRTYTCPAGRLMIPRTNWCSPFFPGESCSGDDFREPLCWSPYSEAQMDALTRLSQDIVGRRSLAPENVLLGDQTKFKLDSPGPALRPEDKAQITWYREFIASLAGITTENKIPTSSSIQITPVSTPIQWPSKSKRVTSCYGDRPTNFHDGIDIGLGRGSDKKIYSIAPGTVHKVCEEWVGECRCTITSDSCPTKCKGRCGNYGNYVIIKHSPNLYSRYSHMDSIAVDELDTVTPQTVIGVGGNTGYSYGDHLDLKIYISESFTKDTGKDPLCFYPNQILSGINSEDDNCPWGPGDTLTHNMLENCEGTETLSTMACSGLAGGVGAITGLDAKLQERLTYTLDNIGDVPGLKMEISNAAGVYGIDESLLISVFAQESVGAYWVVNRVENSRGTEGYAGLGQIGRLAYLDHQDIFGPGFRSDCYCPSFSDCPADGRVMKSCEGDPRFDPKKNAHASAKHLRSKVEHPLFRGMTSKLEFGIAAYNWGEGNVDKAIKKTDKVDPTWEEVAPHAPAETQEYVFNIMKMYRAQGGGQGVLSCFDSDHGVGVKSYGHYSFSPAFSMKVTDLLIPMETLGKCANEIYNRCQGAKDNRKCIREATRMGTCTSSGFNMVPCFKEEKDGVIATEFRSTIQDCLDNQQNDCTCTWDPNKMNLPGDFGGDEKQIKIDLYGNQPRLFTDSFTDGVPNGMRQSLFAEAPGEEIKSVPLTLSMVASNGDFSEYAINIHDMLADGSAGDQTSSTEVGNFTVWKTEAGLVWVADPGEGQACGVYKTHHQVCATMTIPTLYDGQKVYPTVKFALYLRDNYPPETPDDGCAENLGQSIAVLFPPSTSEDISYYKVSCKIPDVEGDPEDFVRILGRENDEPITESLKASLKTCGGEPIPLSATSLDKDIEVFVTPVDISGVEGEPSMIIAENIGDKQDQQSLNYATIFADALGIEIPEIDTGIPLVDWFANAWLDFYTGQFTQSMVTNMVVDEMGEDMMFEGLTEYFDEEGVQC